MSIPGPSTVEVPVLIVGARRAGPPCSPPCRGTAPGIFSSSGTGTPPTRRARTSSTSARSRSSGTWGSATGSTRSPRRSTVVSNLWVTTLAGLEVARSETWGTSAERAADYRAASPEPMANCPQTVLEPMLLAAARDMGADIRFGWEFIHLAQDQDGVTSVVQERDGEATLTVRSQYVVGADGARSRVLGQAGLTVEGPDDLARAANIWFRADLSKYLARRPGVLTWNVMPGPLPPLRLGTLICHKPFTEFVLAFMYDPAQVSLDAMGADELKERISALVGEEVDAEILGVAGWQVRAQIAPAYPRGACSPWATRFTGTRRPTAWGSTCPSRTTYNLGWKLALVLAGRAGAALLDSYSAERQPVGAQGVQRAITSLQEGAAVEAALGYEPGQAAEAGWEALNTLYEPGPAGDERRKRAAQGDRAEQLPVQRPWHRARVPLSQRRHRRRRQPGPHPGARPPAATTSRPPVPAPASRTPGSNANGVPVSSLDLVDDRSFALLTGVGGEAWGRAAAEASARAGVPVRVHVIGGQDGVTDPYGEWASLREVETTGCVLVRPDRHVAWRSTRLHPGQRRGSSPPSSGRRSDSQTNVNRVLR